MGTCKKLPMFSRPGLRTTCLLVPFVIVSPLVTKFSSSSSTCARAGVLFFDPGASAGSGSATPGIEPDSARIAFLGAGAQEVEKREGRNPGLLHQHPREVCNECGP